MSLGTAAVLAAALAASGHHPARQLLATAAAPQPGLAAGAASTPTLPAPVELPQPRAYAVRAPASLSRRPTSTARALGIPAPALTAYQRSAAVIDAADPSCGLGWTLLAAIGQVESDHGQVGGSHLDQHGVALPAIVGPRLDGHKGTSRVDDTDGGRLDGDRRYDRAVGPMQFLPSTWSAVAVDGDDDGRRNVQDIDDASLGSAVYLCADHDDLSTKAGQRAAVLRYNHSQVYAATVLAIARQLRGSSVYVASATVRSAMFTSPLDLRRLGHGPVAAARHAAHHQHSSPESLKPTPAPSTPAPTAPAGPSGPTSPDPTSDPTTSPAAPTSGPATDPGSGPSDPGAAGSTPSSPSDSPSPSDPTDSSSPTPAGSPVIPDPLPQELAGFTPAQVTAYDAAWAACGDSLVDGWSADPQATAGLTACLASQLGVPSDDADLAAFVAWVARP